MQIFDTFSKFQASPVQTLEKRTHQTFGEPPQPKNFTCITGIREGNKHFLVEQMNTNEYVVIRVSNEQVEISHSPMADSRSTRFLEYRAL